jgi:hypothetical protein
MEMGHLQLLCSGSQSRLNRFAALSSALGLGLTAMAASSANYRISPQTVNSGGGRSTSANYEIVSGQGAMGNLTDTVSSGGNYVMRAGYIAQLPIGFVKGRYVFYNDSWYDGNGPAANAADDGAIAPDKTALLPGGTATFANYTSYEDGINGIIIDVQELAAEPVTTDFEFRVGNDNSPDTWPAAPAPSSITTRWGDGVDSSARVTLIWPDNVIEKQWLYVKLLPTENVNTLEEDKFFFGNAIGDTGNSAFETWVNATDISAVRANPHGFFNPAPIDSPYDFNRDRFVNATEVSIIRANPTGFFSDLNLINLTGFGDEPLGDVLSASALGGRNEDGDVGEGSRFRENSVAVADVSAGGESKLGAASREGTDGTPLAFAAITPQGDGRLRFRLTTAGHGERVQIQACEDLSDGWHELEPQPALRQQGRFMEFQIAPDEAREKAFFRIVIED